MTPPHIYLVITLSSPKPTKPPYKIGEIAPLNWPSKHIPDPSSRVTKAITVARQTASVVEDWRVVIDFDKSDNDLTEGSIEGWFEARKDVEEKLEQLVKDNVTDADGKKAKVTRTFDKENMLKGLEIHTDSEGRHVWVDILEVQVELLDCDRF